MDSCNDANQEYCDEGLICTFSEKKQQRVCLQLCAPATSYQHCPENQLCYHKFTIPIKPGSSDTADIFACDIPVCDIWHPALSCGNNQVCVPTIERYGNGACHQKPTTLATPNWTLCNSYEECLPGSVCEKGSNEAYPTCHPYCKPGENISCPSMLVRSQTVSTTCKVRDPRDAWGICDD